MRSCYATFLPLFLLSLCATAANAQSTKSSSQPAAWTERAELTTVVRSGIRQLQGTACYTLGAGMSLGSSEPAVD